MPCAFGGLALVGLIVVRRWVGIEFPWVLAGVAALNGLVPPGVWTARTISAGILTLLLSLACFAIGTAFAVRRQDNRMTG
jgi:hypothetical protein